MFSLGTPVSAFDIAQIVQSMMLARRSGPRKPQASIIESLIEEALLEFTSLTDEEKAEAERNEASSTVERLSTPGTFVDPTNWAHEFSSGDDGTHDVARTGIAGRQLEVGNLSALEDDQTGGATATDALLRETDEEELPDDDEEDPDEPAPRRDSVHGRAPSHAPAALEAAAPSAKGAGGAQGVAIAVAVAVVAFGVAWFAHIIPH